MTAKAVFQEDRLITQIDRNLVIKMKRPEDRIAGVVFAKVKKLSKTFYEVPPLGEPTTNEGIYNYLKPKLASISKSFEKHSYLTKICGKLHLSKQPTAKAKSQH